ncbi:MAG: PAS domain S-box protein [Chloroflexi bacterium]|nr:PAS domain S-box protein [Chloroflexota bacterium]
MKTFTNTESLLNNPIRILLVDDSPYFLDAVRDFLHLQTTLSVAGTATEGQDALAQARRLNPDIILLDLNLGQQSGLALIPLFKQHVPKAKIVILTIMLDETYRTAAMQAGADAFVHKTEMSGTLLSTIFGLAEVSAPDVPERKALFESGGQFRTLFENAPIGIGVADLQGNLLAFNDAMLAPGQYSRADIEEMGNVAALYYDPQERTEALALFQQQGFVKGFEVRFRRKDGSPYHAVLSLTRTIFNGGAAVQAMVEDVTERRQAQDAVREAELRYRSLFEQTHDAIFILDLEGRHLAVNQRAADMLEYSLDEIRGLSVRELSAEPEKSSDVLQRLIAGEQFPVYERLFRKKSGGVVSVEINAELVRDARGNPLHIQSAVRDITERKQAEQALQDSQSQLQAIFNSAMDAIVSIDEDQRIVIFNPAAEQMYGCAAVEAIGKSLSRFIPEDIRHRHGDFVRAFGQSNSTQRSMELPALALTCLRANGEAFPSEVSISQSEIDGKKLYTAIVRDITERRRDEESIRRSEDRYRDLVEHIHDLIGTHDLQGNILSINPSASKLLGMDTDTLLKMNLRDLLVPEARIQFNAYLASIQRDGQASGVMLVQTVSGEKRIWEYDNTLRADSDNGPIVRALARDVTDRHQAEEKIRIQLERLTALREIDQTINSTFDIHLSLNALVLHTARLLSVDAVSVLLLDPITNMLEYGAGVGFWTDASKSARVKLGESYAGRAAKEQRIVDIPNLADEPGNMLLTGLLGGEKFVSYYGTPLIVKGRAIGVLEVFHRSVVERDGEWFDFFNTLAGQAAIAIDNAKLFENLQVTNTELINAYEATIEGWSRALDLRDEETEGHTLRVTEKAVELARLMGFSDEELVHVRRGGLLHDIGKMGVADNILLKPASLTETEWTIMRRHPVFAFELLSPIRYLRSAAIDIPYCHHEKWDGTGYPRRLKGEQIPLAARIFSIVDVYDALTSDRPYRAKWTREKTLDYIKSLDGIQFDPQVVKVFLESLL